MNRARILHRKHAIDRMEDPDRALAPVTYEELRAAVRQCQRSNTPALEKQTCSRSLYRVEIRGVEYFPVWSKRHATVVTLLSREMVLRRLGRTTPKT